jgi:hypothetical protein
MTTPPAHDSIARSAGLKAGAISAFVREENLTRSVSYEEAFE